MSLVDLSGVQASSFAPIPAGKYLVQCAEAKVETTKNKTGQFIKATLQVKTGVHENRKVFTRFNITNQNEDAERIGKEQLKSFLECCGVDANTLEDVNHLVGLVCMANVKVKQDETYGDSNEISYFERAESTEATTTTQTTKSKKPLF